MSFSSSNFVPSSSSSEVWLDLLNIIDIIHVAKHSLHSGKCPIALLKRAIDLCKDVVIQADFLIKYQFDLHELQSSIMQIIERSKTLQLHNQAILILQLDQINAILNSKVSELETCQQRQRKLNRMEDPLLLGCTADNSCDLSTRISNDILLKSSTHDKCLQDQFKAAYLISPPTHPRHSKRLVVSTSSSSCPSSLSLDQVVRLVLDFYLSSILIGTEAVGTESHKTQIETVIASKQFFKRLVGFKKGITDHILRSIVRYETVSSHPAASRAYYLMAVAAIAAELFQTSAPDALELSLWSLSQLSHANALLMKEVHEQVVLPTFASLSSCPAVFLLSCRRLHTCISHLAVTEQTYYMDREYLALFGLDTFHRGTLGLYPWKGHPLVVLLCTLLHDTLALHLSNLCLIDTLHAETPVTTLEILHEFRFIISDTPLLFCETIVNAFISLEAKCSYDNCSLLKCYPDVGDYTSVPDVLIGLGNIESKDEKYFWSNLGSSTIKSSKGIIIDARYFMAVRNVLMASNIMGLHIGDILDMLLDIAEITDRSNIENIRSTFTSVYLAGVVNFHGPIRSWTLEKFRISPLSTAFQLASCYCREVFQLLPSETLRELHSILTAVSKVLQYEVSSPGRLAFAMVTLRLSSISSENTSFLTFMEENICSSEDDISENEKSLLSDKEQQIYRKLSLDDGSNILVSLLAEHWKLTGSLRRITAQVACRLVCSTSPHRTTARALLAENSGENSALTSLMSQRNSTTRGGSADAADRFPLLLSPLEVQLYPRDSLVTSEWSTSDVTGSSALAVEIMLLSGLNLSYRPSGIGMQLIPFEDEQMGFFTDYIGKTAAAIHAIRSEVKYYEDKEFIQNYGDFSFHVISEKLNCIFSISYIFREVFESNYKVLVIPFIVYSFRWHLSKLESSTEDELSVLINHFSYLFACIELLTCVDDHELSCCLPHILDSSALQLLIAGMVTNGVFFTEKKVLMSSLVALLARRVVMRNNIHLLSCLPLYSLCCVALLGDMDIYVDACLQDAFRGLVEKTSSFFSDLGRVITPDVKTTFSSKWPHLIGVENRCSFSLASMLESPSAEKTESFSFLLISGQGSEDNNNDESCSLIDFSWRCAESSLVSVEALHTLISEKNNIRDMNYKYWQAEHLQVVVIPTFSSFWKSITKISTASLCPASDSATNLSHFFPILRMIVSIEFDCQWIDVFRRILSISLETVLCISIPVIDGYNMQSMALLSSIQQQQSGKLTATNYSDLDYLSLMLQLLLDETEHRNLALFLLACPIELLMPLFIQNFSLDHKGMLEQKANRCSVILSKLCGMLIESFNINYFADALQLSRLNKKDDKSAMTAYETLWIRIFFTVCNLFSFCLSLHVIQQFGEDHVSPIHCDRVIGDNQLNRCQCSGSVTTSKGNVIHLNESCLSLLSLAHKVREMLFESQSAYLVLQSKLKVEWQNHSTRCSWTFLTKSFVKLIIQTGVSSRAASAVVSRLPTQASGYIALGSFNRRYNKELDSLVKVSQKRHDDILDEKNPCPRARNQALSASKKSYLKKRPYALVDEGIETKSDILFATIAEPPRFTDTHLALKVSGSSTVQKIEVLQSSSNEIAKKFGVLF